MIDWAYSDLFYGSHHKQWSFADLDNQITLLNENIVGESISFERCLCESEYYTLGTYSSACIRVKIDLSAFGTSQRFKGDRFYVCIIIADDFGENHELNVGWFKCYSDTLSSDRKSRELVMYDALYELPDIDVAKWYNDLFLEDGGRDSITLIELRTRLLTECLNLDDNGETLPNDLLEVHKSATYRTLSASTLLKQILAVNVHNCYLTNNNKLHYHAVKHYGWDAYNRVHTITPDIVLDASKFYSCSYEEYQVLYADQLKIQIDADNAQVYGVRQLNDLPIVHNTLELDYNNMFFRDKSFDDLRPFLYNIWDDAHWRISFTPAEIELRGNYCYEPGDVIQVTVQDPVTESTKTFYTVIVRQTIRGLQALKMTLSTKGDEYFTAPLSVESTSYDDYAGSDPSSGGASVIANPAEGATASLTKVKINGVVYSVGAGSIEVESDFVEIIRNIGFRLLDEPSNVSVEYDSVYENVKLNWTDPSDILTNEPVPATWAGTVVVRKEGSVPRHRWDGTLIVDSTTRNEYSVTELIDSSVLIDKMYYYGIFPYDTKGDYRFTKVIALNTYHIPIPDIVSISVSGTDVTIYYSVPSEYTWSEIGIVYKMNSAPESRADGYTEDITSGTGSVTISGLRSDTTYYFRVFSTEATSSTQYIGDARSAKTDDIPVEDVIYGLFFSDYQV